MTTPKSSTNAKQERPKIAQDEAMNILDSALDYVRGSGLPLKIANVNGWMVIGVYVAALESGTCQIVPDNVPDT